MPWEERELRLVSPVGVPCVVQIHLVPLYKQKSAEQTQNCTHKYIRGENGVTRILKLSVAEGLRAKSEIRSMVSGVEEMW